jgi:hypothetical protein
MRLSHSFAEGAERRLPEHHLADDWFTLIDYNRSYLLRWLSEWGAQKSCDDCKTEKPGISCRANTIDRA